MSKLTALITSLVLILTLFFILPSLLITQRLDSSVENSLRNISLTLSAPVEFFFTPSHDHINQIDLQLKNPNLLDSSIIQVEVTASNYQYLTSFTGFNIGDPSWVSLKIPDLSSVNIPVKIKISTHNNIPETLFVISDSSNQPNFRSFYRPTITSILNIQYNRLISRDSTFTIIYLTLIFGLNFIYLITHDNN